MHCSKLALSSAALFLTLGAGQAHAQHPAAASTTPAGDGSVPPQSSDATPAPATDAAANTVMLQEQVDRLRQQLEALQAQMAQVAKASPTFKGAPEFVSDNGFKFKMKGFAQFDAGYVSTPGPNLAGVAAGLNYQNLGWNTRARRLVIGAEGSLPGGFGFKTEFNLAQGTVDYEDVILTYQRKGSPLQFTVGNFYPLSSLDTMTSSRLGSFLERAAFTDAFNYNRRLGLAIAYLDPADQYSLTAGLFSQEINNTNFNRTGWQASARATYSPVLGNTRLHLGANYQHRVAQRDAQNVRYRSRPFTQVTDQRFIDTGAIAADGDDIAGFELGAIHGPLHFAGEAQKVWVRGYRPGKLFGANNGADNAAFYAGDPSFTSAYAEVGYYLTGETRGYKGGKWDRTKVLNPFDEGGWGALQLNARLDYVDLEDRVATGPTLAAPDFVNGGKQTGYQLSLIWNPMDYLRFMAQYARAHVVGGPRAGTVVPTSIKPVDERSYDVDTFALRAQIEF